MTSSHRCTLLMTLTALAAGGCSTSFLLGQNEGDGPSVLGGAGAGGTLAEGGVGGAGVGKGGAGAGGATGAPGAGGAPAGGGGGGPQPRAVRFIAGRNYPAGYAVGIAVGDANRDGRIDMIVASDLGVSVLAGAGDGTFAAPLTSAMIPPSTAIATDDLNGDGNLDAVVVSSDGGLHVLFGGGDGTFRAGGQYAVAAVPFGVAIGDLDGDGKPDFAATSSVLDTNVGRTGTLSLFLNRGDGTFVAGDTYTNAAAPFTVAMRDLDGDGNVDVIVSDSLPPAQPTTATAGLWVFFNAGRGKLQAPIQLIPGEDPEFVTVADLNGDGRPDIVCSKDSNSVSALINRGNRTFDDLPVSGSNASGPVAIADVDGDGQADLVAADHLGTIEIIPGHGDGTFGEATVYAGGYQAKSLVTADFDGDGRPDVATANDMLHDTVDVANGGYVNVLMNRGAGAFVAPMTYGGGPPAVGVAIADIDGDARPDIAIGAPGAGVSVFLGFGDGSFAASLAMPLPDPGFLTAGDLDGDGRPDLVTVNSQSGTISVLLNQTAGAPTFLPPADYAVGSSPLAAALADLNGDALLDIAVSNGADGSVSVLLNRGQGVFAPSVEYAVGTDLAFVAASDLDGDGKPDLIVGDAVVLPVPSGYVRVLFNNGDGTFAAPVSHPVGLGTGVAVADLNGDGYRDLIATSGTDGTVSILVNDGRGGFAAAVPYFAGWNATQVSVADFNGDGALDLAVICATGNVALLLNRGDGTFAPAVGYGGGGGLDAIAVGDLNGDGKPDLAIAVNASTRNLAVLLNASP